MAFEPTTTTMAIQMVVALFFRIISEIVAYARPFIERVRTCVFAAFRIDLNTSGYTFEDVRAFALLEVPLLPLPGRNVQWLSRAPLLFSHMLATRTTEPQRPTSGKVGPCPRPKACNNHRPKFNFCSKRWILVIFGSEQPSILLFGSEGRVNRLVRSNTSRRKGRGWSHINCHGPLPVRAEASVPRWKTGPRLPDWQPLRGDLKATNTNARPYEIRWFLNQPPRPWQFKWLSNVFE